MVSPRLPSPGYTTNYKWRKTYPDSAAEWRDTQGLNLPETTRQNLLREEVRTEVTP